MTTIFTVNGSAGGLLRADVPRNALDERRLLELPNITRCLVERGTLGVRYNWRLSGNLPKTSNILHADVYVIEFIGTCIRSIM